MLVVIALVMFAVVARAEAAAGQSGSATALTQDDPTLVARQFAQALIGDDEDGDDVEDDDSDAAATAITPDDVAPADLEPADLLDDDDGDNTRALLDAEQTPGGALAGDDATYAAAPAGADEVYEASLRRQRPSRWGQLDFGLSLRRSLNAPAHSPAYQTEELWLLATWRQ